MSKLVLFLFLGVCVMAALAQQEPEQIDEKVEEHLRKIEPQLRKSMLDDGLTVNEWEDWWERNKPSLRILGKNIMAALNAPTEPPQTVQ